jgi:hypothetical protein
MKENDRIYNQINNGIKNLYNNMSNEAIKNIEELINSIPENTHDGREMKREYLNYINNIKKEYKSGTDTDTELRGLSRTASRAASGSLTRQPSRLSRSSSVAQPATQQRGGAKQTKSAMPTAKKAKSAKQAKK